MSENKRFVLWRTLDLDEHTDEWAVIDASIECTADDKEEYNGVMISHENILSEEEVIDLMNKQEEEIQQLRRKNRRFKRYMNNGEHIRLSININTGELQRHIYATGQWFGDFDRVLCRNWISKENYQKFVDRIIEVYNTEFREVSIDCTECKWYDYDWDTGGDEAYEDYGVCDKNNKLYPVNCDDFEEEI